MAEREQKREKFLDMLASTPFINHACKKAGVARATIYRWMKDNYRFKQKVLKALDSGRENLIEVAEVTLVNKIRGGDLSATKFFLTHNSKRYRQERKRSEKELEKKNPIKEAFFGLDGNLALNNKMKEYVKNNEEEKRKRKNIATGLSDQ